MHRIPHLAMLIALCVSEAIATPALAQHTVFVSPDVATDDPGDSETVLQSWDVLAYHSPDYQPVPVVSFPERTVVDALHKLDAPGCWLFSVGTSTELPPGGGVVFHPQDVIQYDGSTYALYFDGSANGVPPGVNVDAAFLIGGDSGDLVISFDVATTIGAETFEAADLVRFTAGSFSLYFDASTAGAGIAGSSNLVGAAACGGTVLAFDVATDLSPTTGPATYARGNLAEWDGANFNLFDSLAGWPRSSVINALTCCADEDGDIICNQNDNCPADPNADQQDADSDGLGDECDPCQVDPLNDPDTDGVCGGIDNCPSLYNPGQANVDSDGFGDLCDSCPADPLDDCDTDGSTAEEVPADEGGTIETPDGSLTLDIPAGALDQDTTISVTELVPGESAVDLTVGPNPGDGQAVSVFDLEPDGQEFDPPVTLTFVADVSEVHPNHLEDLTLYLWTDTDSDGVEDRFVDVPGAACSVVNDPPGCDPSDPPAACVSTVTCTAEVDHFSVYALVAPFDGDDDGIPDLFGGIEDICPEGSNVIDGFHPPMADLVPNGEDVPLPERAFKGRGAMPMRFDYYCGTVPVTDQDAVTPPELLEVWRVGDAEPLPLVDPDVGEANDSGLWFRYTNEHWMYNLDIRDMPQGTYEVGVRMPDGRVFKGGFVLR